MNGSEQIATYWDFERHLLLLNQCGHEDRAQAERERGFIVWRRNAIEKDLNTLRRLCERASKSIVAGIKETITEMENELEECVPFATA